MRRVALLLRRLLARVGLDAHVKTSGSLELRVHAPLAEPIDGKGFARELAGREPALVTADMRRAGREGKVYVDWLQNGPSRPTVAPYSVRGLPVPTVATPVRWEEVERAAAGRRPELLVFGPDDVLERVERDADPFASLR